MPRDFRSLISAAAGLSMPAAIVAVILGEVLVAVPVAAREAVVGAAPHLHETDAALQHAAGDQAVAAEVFGDWCRRCRRVLAWRRISLEMSITSGALTCSFAAIS